ncbi:uncharacterized protein LOC121368315 [Gigantopelta aegis]|uniref:uncharacterized protein LOC121368315 n=1 Tax=Gigantopelta aegis TaxID=1735272 RepID=UPI001B8877F4|nr:uncharacterized protein LOC121368315 [Gigantopelta aegis]
MSFLRNGKGKEKDLLAKKSQFYVEFLGWMETNGLRGVKYTDPVIRELRRRQKQIDRPPKLTIQVSKKELKITQDVEEKKKRSIKKIKFPTIPARDVTFAVQSMRPHDGRPDDVVACIYLGYMPRTGRDVHVHVYRFDEPQTATTFVRMLNQLTDSNEDRIREAERELAAKGQIEPVEYTRESGLGSSDGMSDGPYTGDSAADSAASNSTYSDESPTFDSDDIDPDLQSLSEMQAFDSVTDELRQRLNINRDNAPILLPPTDYDTISRARGNFTKNYEERRCNLLGITGNPALDRTRKESGESGIDVNSPSGENAPLPGSYGGSPTSDPREFIYPPQEAHHPISKQRSGSYKNNSSSHSPPVPRKPNSFVNARDPYFNSSMYNPRQDQLTRHGRQSSQTSNHSAGSFRSQDEEEIVVYQKNTDSPLPPTDYYQEPEVEMRRSGLRQYNNMNRLDLGRSLSPQMLRRELGSTNPRAAGGVDMYDIRRSQNDVVQYSDGFNSPRSGYNSPRPGTGDFPVRRVHSMLR